MRVTVESHWADPQGVERWLRENGIDPTGATEVELTGEGMALLRRFVRPWQVVRCSECGCNRILLGIRHPVKLDTLPPAAAVVP